MSRALAVITASKSSPLISKSGFNGYDYCLNPYVGCSFGCAFCYVRFFIKDKDHDWGKFVRVRHHIADKLPRELRKPVRLPGKEYVTSKGKKAHRPGPPATDENGETILEYQNKRLVIGTMTDPYQPIERKVRVTRKTLEVLLANPTFNKVGIFTRSPIILEDLDLIKELPRPRVHYSISPYSQDIIQKLEPIGIKTTRRLDTIRKLKDAGIRVHVNVAPVLPGYSEGMTEYLAEELGKIGIDEFFVDPVQPYGEAFTAMQEALGDDPQWKETEKIIATKPLYLAWKQGYWDQWKKSWSKLGSKNTLAIWSDHEHRIWKKLVSGESMDRRVYGDDLES